MSTTRQFSFSGGEISPSLYARCDTSKYQSGLRTCRNTIIPKHGGSASRPGTEYIAETRNSRGGGVTAVRLIPFVFNVDQTYVLEFGYLYLRVYKDGAQMLESPMTITGITNASPGVVTAASHGFTTGQNVTLSVVGMPQLNGRTFFVGTTTTNTFQLKDLDLSLFDTTGLGTFVSGTAARVYTVTTPYLDTDLPDLQFVQSTDTITLVHPGYAPRELQRHPDGSWTLTTITFGPSIDAPTGVAITSTFVAGSNINIQVTSVSATGEESLGSATFTCGNTIIGVPPPWILGGNRVAGAISYNVYFLDTGTGIYAYLQSIADPISGTTWSATIDTTTLTSGGGDESRTPPAISSLFNSTDNYPSTVTYFQQRLMFANTNNNPETVWASRSGFFHNFATRFPSQDDDAVTFTMVGRQANSVEHLLQLRTLLIMTQGGEWTSNGDSNGILTPTSINLIQYSYNGSSRLSPIVVGTDALYVQARGSVVRDLSFDFLTDSYKGNDLTVFANHLIDGFTLVDWTYGQIPNSIVWMVRSDGTLLGLTYIKEQQILAWHRHDFDGQVLNVCSVPEGLEDAVYVVVSRQVNGGERIYIERFATRFVGDIVDFVGMDAALSYDGRGAPLSGLSGTITQTLSGGTGLWDYTQTLTMTASASYFTAASVGQGIHLTGSDGTLIRFMITGYSSGTVVTGQAQKNIPVAMQGAAISTWAQALQTFGGLWHLEGKQVSVLADGFVVGSPNNPTIQTVLTVTNGSVTLDRPYAVVHIGLPVINDIETLDIDTVQGETMADKRKMIGRLTVFTEKSRGVWAGTNPANDRTWDGVDQLYGLAEAKVRELESVDDPVALATGTIEINLQAEWNSNGRVFIRQVDPLPLSILAIAPQGFIPIDGRY